MEQFETFQGRLPESQGQNLALTVEHVPYSLNSGPRKSARTSPGYRGDSTMLVMKHSDLPYVTGVPRS